LEATRGPATRTLKVSAINVAFQRKRLHRPESYALLLQRLAALNRAIKYHGDRRLLLSSTFEDDRDDKRLFGVFDRFTDIDAFNWYNRRANRAATRAERARITVPPEMRANYRGYYFLFDLRRHLLVFPIYDAGPALSARQVQYVIEELVSDERIAEEFGPVAVSIVQEPEALETILGEPQLLTLSIEINRPNASLGGLDDDYEDQMDTLQASQYRVELVADESGSLKPDDAVRKTASVALQNGVVNAKVVRNSRIAYISTEDRPVAQTEIYSPRETDILGAFRNVTASLLKRIAAIRPNR
jgi:hypothetical protein